MWVWVRGGVLGVIDKKFVVSCVMHCVLCFLVSFHTLLKRWRVVRGRLMKIEQIRIIIRVVIRAVQIVIVIKSSWGRAGITTGNSFENLTLVIVGLGAEVAFAKGKPYPCTKCHNHDEFGNGKNN